MNSTKILYPLETDMCETEVRKQKDNWKNISKHLNDMKEGEDISWMMNQKKVHIVTLSTF